MSEIKKYQDILISALSQKKEEIKKQLEAEYESVTKQFNASLDELKKTVLNQIKQ
mgnify:CR=1 FL=1